MMTAYIIGLIAGTVCAVSPLLYLMNFDRCLAHIIAEQPQFDPNLFSPAAQGLAYNIAAIGAVVMLISVAMIALTGLGRIKTQRTKPQSGRESVVSESPASGLEP